MSRVAVVTGSNKGIGLSIVRGLLTQFKGTVYLTSRDAKRGNEAVKLLNSEGLKPKFHQLDVTNNASVTKLKEYLIQNYGGVDVFIHNAGIMYGSSDNVSFAEGAKNTIQTNYLASVNICNTILPIMRSHGRLVLLSSMLSLSAFRNCSTQNQNFFKSPDLTEQALTEKMLEYVEAAQTGQHRDKGFSNDSYGMSKLGVNVLVKLLGNRACQLEAQNVLVNCCCPGWVNTQMGGKRAPLTPDQGARIPIMLGLIPINDSEPNGKFLKDFKVVDWSNV
uniref:carbonyl reductase [NADPH] 1-like n=1 Tax=Styela clava TaxID=7725 RepID=UPI00193ADE4B|nr:carbonyl reductase [NADPH] 1-like [Styela clava]